MSHLNRILVSKNDIKEAATEALGQLTETEEDELMTWRILIIVFTVLTGLTFFIPFCRCCQRIEGQVVRYPETVTTYFCKNRCIQFMNCFAGGALFSLALCHILPETQKEYVMYLKSSDRKYMFFEKFPFVYFLIIAGFLLTLCLDQVLFKPTWKTVEIANRAKDYIDDSKELDQARENRQENDADFPSKSVSVPQKQDSKQQMLSNNGQPGNLIHEGGHQELIRINADKTIILDKTNFYYEGGEVNTEEAQIDTERQLNDGDEEEAKPKPPALPAPEVIAPQSLFIVGLIFILHSFIMGLAIGAFKEVKEIGLIAIIVIVQKIPISLSFGVMFLSASRLCCSAYTLIFGLLFTAATPVGVGLMWAELGEDLRKTDPAILCIQGVVCGAIIYIACSDLIAREFQASQDINPNDQRDQQSKNNSQRLISILKLFFVLLGCAFVILIFTVGGQDLTDPDSGLQKKVEINLPKPEKNGD